jgi:hypothetical protein
MVNINYIHDEDDEVPKRFDREPEKNNSNLIKEIEFKEKHKPPKQHHRNQ